MKTRNLILIFASLGILGCDKGPTGPAQIQALDFGPNTVTRYCWTVSGGDSLSQSTLIATDTLLTTIASTDDVVGSNFGLIRMEADSVPHYIATTKVWYKSYPDSLVEVAYRSAGSTPVVLPKVTQQRHAIPFRIASAAECLRLPLTVRLLLNADGIQDSTIERSDKRTVYKYPLAEGSSWISFSYPFLELRKVEGYEMVSAGGRSFWCAKIRTTLPQMDPEIEWYDYVSWQGLIKRTNRVHTFFVTEQNPDGPGTEMWMDESLTMMD